MSRFITRKWYDINGDGNLRFNRTQYFLLAELCLWRHDGVSRFKQKSYKKPGFYTCILIKKEILQKTYFFIFHCQTNAWMEFD